MNRRLTYSCSGYIESYGSLTIHAARELTNALQIVGPKDTSVPSAGLPATETRAQPIARLIVDAISAGADPDDLLMYNPLNWNFENGTAMPAETNWLDPPIDVIVNNHSDAFSQRSVCHVHLSCCLSRR